MTLPKSPRKPVKKTTPGTGRKKVLRQNDEVIRNFLETLPDIVLVHRDGIILYVNPAMVETLGRSPGELLHKPVWDFIPPEYQARVAASIRKRTETGKDEPYDIEIVPREGERRAVLVRGSVIEFDGAAAMLSVLTDITDRKMAEAELQKSRYHLSEAMDMAHMADWEMDGPTSVFTFNDRFYALYSTTAGREGGYQMPAEVYAREFVHPDDQAVVGEEIAKALSTTDSGYFSLREHRIIRRDGEVRWITVRVRVSKDAQGRTIKTHGVNQDITDRKRAEEALARSEEQFRSIVETSPDMIWETDPQGKFRYMSPTIRTILGYSPEEVIGKSITDLVPDEAKSASMEELMRMVSQEGALSPIEVTGRHRNGRDMLLEIRPARLTDSDGRLKGFRGVTVDITERKKAEVALRESEKKFASVFQSSPAMLVLISLKEGTFIDANEAFIRNTGYSRDEVIGRRLESLGMFPERDIYERIATTLRDRQFINGMEVRVRIKNGEIKTGLYSARTLSMGGDTYVLSSIEDITERKKMEEAIREARQLFSDIISFLPDPTFVIDKEGKVLAWNRALEHLSGVPAPDIIGKGNYEYSVWSYGKRRPVLIDLVLHPDQDSARMDYTGIARDGHTITAQAQIVLHGSGHKVPLLLIASPLFDPEGNVTGAIESMRDITRLKEAEAELARFNANLEKIIAERTQALNDEITQRKKAEQEVHAALEYNRSVIEANPDLMVVLDRKGVVLDTNSATEKMTGVLREQIIGTPYSRYLVDDSTPTDILQQLSEKGRAEYTVQLRRTDGHVTPLAINTTLFRGKDATDARIIVAGHDITRQKKDKAAIQAALDEQVLLLREVHHRVNNNLQIIISLTNLQMRQTDDPNVKQILSETQNRVRAMSLVHEKLYRSPSLSHIEFADYTRFLSTQLFSYYTMDTRRVRLDVTLGNIMVDIVTAVPLGLLMNELVSNALRHAFPQEREGVIRISGGSEDGLITLIVGDDGIGIPADLDWKNTKSLGMRLINSLVDQLDGTITLDRENGTAFTITVKRNPASGE